MAKIILEMTIFDDQIVFGYCLKCLHDAIFTAHEPALISITEVIKKFKRLSY